jgi:pimeloyl-ACP methyl ester carboxylesterase
MATIVLVGGAWLGAWAWERVTPVLTAAGHDVHPVTLTGLGDRAHLGSEATGLTTHATDLVAAIEMAGLRDVVLVAHSYGGLPATIAASRIPDRIRRLVYVAATLPVPGRTLFDLLPAGAEDLVRAAVDAHGDGWRVPVLIDPGLDAYWAEGGLTPAAREWLLDRGVGQPVGCYRDAAPADLGAVEAVPRTYVVCTADPGEPPVTAGTPGFDLVTLDSGHWPMVTCPAELAHLIGAVART